MCDSKNSKFIKEHEASGLLSSLGIKTPCFQHDMAYGDFKDLTRGTADKILRDKAFSNAKNPKYDGYENGLVSMIYNFFDEKSSGSDIENEKMLKKELAELHKQII